MEAHRRGNAIVVGEDARQRFHDARGYGRPLGGSEIELAPVEAAHLLFRGDLDAVDGEGFAAFFESVQVGGDVGARFLAYADFRDRGFYLAPARDGWVDDPGDEDFVVFARGAGPPDGEVGYRVRVVGERTPVPATELGEAVLAVVDEEGEVTYLDTDRPAVEGASTFEPPHAAATLLADRVVIWDPPAPLYERGFYGQPLAGRAANGPLQLSLVEAAYLTERSGLDLAADAVAERGRAVEGERFDRRLRVYATLRNRGVVPKTGFKFGADFRTYAEVTSIEDLGHSEDLIRVIPGDHAFTPRELALDVRLAGGVRKRMVFAAVDPNGEATADGIRWISVDRLTP